MFDVELDSPPDIAITSGRRRPVRAVADVAEQITALSSLDHADLRAAWSRLYRANPPKKISRDLLELAVAWKLQEQALGGGGSTLKRQLAALARAMESKGDLAKCRAVKLKAGARLVREWHGQTHDVLVLEAGFSWQGQHWRSLSAIARAITGTAWSGPRFFGLTAAERRAGSPAPTADPTDAGDGDHA